MAQATFGLGEPFGYGRLYPDWVDVTTPAAGATQTVTIEGRWYVKVLAARLSLTTDANAADRLVTLDYIDARGKTRARNGTGVVITASTTAQAFEWHVNRSVGDWAANTPIWVPLAPFILPPGFTVKFNVTNIQAADAISGLSLWVEKFPTGPDGYPVGAQIAPPTG